MEREEPVNVEAAPPVYGEPEPSGNNTAPEPSRNSTAPDGTAASVKRRRKGPRENLMKRNAAREVAVHLAYELSFTDRTVEALLAERLTAESFASLAEEDPLYAVPPDDLQIRYITRLVTGISGHAAELDGYIEKYAVGWKFSRIPLMASAIMRAAMYEILYMPEIPNAAAVNSAVDIAKKYETPETVKFINGILGSFARQELA